MKRKIVCLFLCAVLFCIPLTAHAALPETETPLQPQWNFTGNYYAQLTINDDGKFECVTGIVAATTAQKIEVTMKLQKLVIGIWMDQESWSTTVNGSEIFFFKTATVSSGTYRVKSECKVTSGIFCDEFDTYSNQVTV